MDRRPPLPRPGRPRPIPRRPGTPTPGGDPSKQRSGAQRLNRRRITPQPRNTTPRDLTAMHACFERGVTCSEARSRRRASRYGECTARRLPYFCAVRPRKTAISRSREGLTWVELRGLEPLTPYLQNTRRLSATVAHLGLRPRCGGQDRFVSD